MKLQRLLVVLSLFLAPVLLAQSANIALGVTDAPDPVSRDGTITYTVQVSNAGPDAATNAAMTVYNSSGLGFVSVTEPAGWSCTEPPPGAFVQFTCTNPSFGSGASSTFTLVATTDTVYYGNNEGNIATSFSAGSSTTDPDQTNNQVQASTAYIAPDADMGVTVTDSPDPVFENGTITYTVQVSNAGPDPGQNATLTVNNSSGLGFVSVTEPAGWSCTEPAAGAFVQFSCTNPSLAVGASSTFTLVATTDTVYYGSAEGTITTTFSVGSDQIDPDHDNNVEHETTAYVTPDADVSVTVSDSPDPVFPDGNITYTVTVANAGPDTAPNITLSSFGGNNLRFVSGTAPAGWSCTLPPSGTQTTSYTCTSAAGLTSGDSDVFTFVMQADDEFLGISDQTILFGFSAHSSVTDEVDNNSETESTQYTTPDADLSITATDSPDPVTNGGNVTFTVNVANGGPQAAPNAQVTLAPHPSLTFQSVTAPAGWTCTTPALNAAGVVTCTMASFPNGGTGQFTLVTRAVTSGSGGTLNSTLSIGSNIQDPDQTDNQVVVTTNWIGQTSDLSISKSTLATAAAQGESITYTISTSNAGPTDATGVTVTDVLPTQLRFQSITAPAGWSCTTPAVGANGTITCTIATFANGATANFTLVTTVAPNATGAINNSASIGFTGGSDPTPGNSSGSSSTVTIAADANLGVTKNTTTTTVAAGGTISYTINVTNAGPEPAASVVMTDVLPASLRFQSITAPAGWTCTTPAVGANGTVTCTAATLPTGATATFTLVTTVASTATGTVTNTATASHSGTDGNPTNNSGTSTPTTITVTGADLSIVKNTGTTTAPAGSTLSYTIAITNAGPLAAANVSMTDVLPASLQFVSIASPAGWTCTTPAVNTNGTITCTAPTLANGATANFTLTVRVAPNATSGTVTNSASVTSSTPDPDDGDTTDPAPPVTLAPANADVSITKTTNTTSATTGQTVTWTITVANAGPSTATNVVVTDTLPAGTQFVSATPSQGTCSGTTNVTCSLGSLNSGANATITLRAMVTATSGTISNTASVATTGDPDNSDNTVTTPPFPVGAPATLAQVPTLSEWALIALAMMIAAIAMRKMV